MPQFILNPGSSAILPQLRAYARVHPGTSWPASEADWEYLPLLQPRWCRDCVAPEVPKAELCYEYGTIKREWTTNFFTESPGVLDGYYVQILIQLQGFAPVPVWIGTIEHDLTRPESDTRLEGMQRFTAWGLARLIEKQPIDRMFAEQDNRVLEIRRLPRFNERSAWGNALLGNRSLEEKTHDSEETYVHSGKGDRTAWTALNVVDLLRKRFRPTGWNIGLSGQWQALDTIKDVWDPNQWPNVKVALDDLISRKRGPGWYLISSGFGTIWIHVFSYSDIPVVYGGAELPANAWPTVLTLPSAYPWTHLIDPLEFAFSQCAQFDTILIESEDFLRAMFTVSYEKRGKNAAEVELDGDGNLIQGWPTATETTVRTINAGSDAANDTARSDDLYSHVYARHLIGNDRSDPTKFDWMVNGGDKTNPKRNVAWTAKDDATVDHDEPSDVFLGEKTLERELPILKHRKYDEAPAGGQVQSEQPANTDPEFVELLAIIRDPLYKKPDDQPNAPDDVYALIDHMEVLSPPAANMSLTPLDKGLGVQVGCAPPHRLAKNHWEGATPTAHAPEFDYKDLIVTCSVRLDQRLHVRLQRIAFPRHHTERTYRILVPGVEYWRAAENTVIGVKSNRTLKRIHPDNLVLRNDGPRLEAFGAFLQHWHSRTRNTVEIPFKTLGLFAPLGALLKGVNGVILNQPINTVITARHMTFPLKPEDEESIETRLQTGAWSAEESWSLFAA